MRTQANTAAAARRPARRRPRAPQNSRHPCISPTRHVPSRLVCRHGGGGGAVAAEGGSVCALVLMEDEAEVDRFGRSRARSRCALLISGLQLHGRKVRCTHSSHPLFTAVLFSSYWGLVSLFRDEFMLDPDGSRDLASTPASNCISMLAGFDWWNFELIGGNCPWLPVATEFGDTLIVAWTRLLHPNFVIHL